MTSPGSSAFRRCRKTKQGSRFGNGGHGSVERSRKLDLAIDQCRIRRRQLAFTQMQCVLHARAGVPLERQTDCGEREVMPADGDNLPNRVPGQSPNRRDEVVGGRGHTTAHTQDDAELQRLVEESLVAHAQALVKVPEVVYLQLRLDARI